MENTLYSQATWDAGYQDLEFTPVDPSTDQVARWMLQWAGSGQGRSALEVGCFPGRYLELMGRQGFEANGVDLTPRTESEVPRWLKAQGVQVGQVAQADFFQWNPGRQFDLVYSNGFIEHFADWTSVLNRHLELVAPGGTLLVSVPNFMGPLQKWVHEKVDSENLARHELGSMDPALWIHPVQAAGFEVIWNGYFNEFDFWVGVQKRTIPQKTLYHSLRLAKPLLKRILPKGRSAWAPYCGMVARRTR